MLFSIEILLHIAQYLPYQFQVELVSTCKDYYTRCMKKHIRRMFLRNDHVLRCLMDDWFLSKVLSCVDDPGRQLTWGSIEEEFASPILPFYSWKKIKCPMTFLDSFAEIPICVQQLEITVKRMGSSFLSLLNSHQTGLSDLNLSLGFTQNYLDLSFLPDSLKTLTIESGLSVTLPTLLPQLVELNLVNCPFVTDVTSFGFIPRLKIERCDNITDISALNHNYSVALLDNANIFDFTESFAHAVVIHIRFNSLAVFDFSHWLKVKSLTISGSFSGEISFRYDNRNLPPTVSRFSGSTTIVPELNGRLTTTCLQEVRLEFVQELSTLVGYNLHEIPIVRLLALYKLTSLEGLGGKNQRVSVRGCHLIQDYSPLRYIPHVTISGKGFYNVEDVDHVQYLTLEDVAIPKPHLLACHLLSLTLIGTAQTEGFHGLECIPSLEISSRRQLDILEDFLQSGAPLRNHRIVFNCWRSDRDMLVQLGRMFDTYLRSDYFYSEIKPQRECLQQTGQVIWLRKVVS